MTNNKLTELKNNCDDNEPICESAFLNTDHQIVQNNNCLMANESDNTYDNAIDFETAITATGYGKFNILLILVTVPAALASQFETTTMSFVFPAAQCDLNLSLSDKGLLNAITFIGMISSGVFWGFLADTFGRKRLLVFGYLVDGIFVLISSTSQNVTVLIVAKFMGGFIINGPYSALASYLSEFHCAKYRARVQLIIGFIYSFGSFLLPLLAWLVLPQKISLVIIQDFFVLHSWNIYLLTCGLAPLTSGVIFIFMPESPKFLMTIGQNQKALEVFQMVYRLNTGKSIENYPVKKLVEETERKDNDASYYQKISKNRTNVQALKQGIQQLKPLFCRPFLGKIVFVCLIQGLVMMSLNTLRLWIPQIFQTINDYKYFNNGTTSSLCTMLELITPQIKKKDCFVNMENSFVYVNTIVIALVCMGGYLAAGFLINTIGKKRLLCALAISSGACGACMYFSHNTATILALSALFVALGSICLNVVLAVIVDLFPTTLRTMTVALAMMSGRIGAMTGNLLFPMFLKSGCAPPFFIIGSVLIFSGIISLFLPNTEMKALL